MFTFIGCIFYCNFLCFQEQLKYTVFLVKKNLRWNMDKTFLLDIPKVSDWKKKKEKMKENQMMYCWICVKVNQSTWTSSLWMEYQILNHVKVSFRWQFAPSPPCAHLLHFPLTHSAPGMLASSLFIKPTRCSSTSGPWHCCSLCLARSSFGSWLIHSLPPGFHSNTTSPMLVFPDF